MALEEYAGQIVMEVDGQEVEVTDLNVANATGRKLVKTMNRSGRAKGFARGIAEYGLSLTVVIPLAGDIDWAAVEGAKITVFPLGNEQKRESYLDCFVVSVGEKYQVDGEARRDLSMQALRKVAE
jgi:hypothetical protein